MSYSLARLAVPRAVFDLVADKLRAAGYDHVFHGDTIDMTHIGLEVDASAVTPRPDAAAGELIEVARAVHALVVGGVPRRRDPHGYLTDIGRAVIADVEALIARAAAGEPGLTPGGGGGGGGGTVINFHGPRHQSPVNVGPGDQSVTYGPGGDGVTTLGAALTDPRVLRGQRWVGSRIATSIGTASARFEVWQFRVADGMAETRFYNPDRESADGMAVGWRPWRPARDFGIEQLRQPATIIEPTEHAP